MQTVAARWYTKGRISTIRLIVIHSMEAPEKGDTAENVARYFSTTGTQASAHICVDNNSAVRCVPDSDTAWAAPGANADGLQLELAGYARQTRADWLDPYSLGVLDQAAIVTADWCRRYNIPPKRLTRDQLKAGYRGITCHVDVSAVYKRSDHTDPGPGFPWDVFLAEVANRLGTARDADTPASAVAASKVTAPLFPGRLLRLTSPMRTGDDVRVWQRQMRARGWSIAVDGVYGPASEVVCRAFQTEKGLAVDGIVGPDTWRAAWEAPIT